ncbi:MAG: hypothetical protein R3264_16930 [Anaerolineae bacterium]|nr:hypothetical protein [Anaerolineae bacterium]
MQPALQLLGKLFNIRRHEWPRFAIIYLTYFIVLTGMQWGRPIVEAAFLTEVGVRFLPWVFVLNGLITIVFSAIYTAFADRVSNRILLAVLFAASIVGIIIGLLLLQSTAVAVFIPLVLLFLVLNVPLQDLFNVHWPIYVNSFYDTQSAKRIIPILASGARFAGIAAGLSLPYLNRLFQPDPTVGIVFVWMLTLVAGLALAWFMPAIVRRLRPAASPEASATFPTQPKAGKDQAAYLDNIREGYRYVTQSTYLRWLAVAAVLTYALLPLINFQ